MSTALKNGDTVPLCGDVRPGVAAGDRIGPYTLRNVLGEGGMGLVWLAEQFNPIRRQVALKLIKAGMDSARVLARFDNERQALALMDHPSIAKIFDAGVVGSGQWAVGSGQRPVGSDERTIECSEPVANAAPPTGRPYFVMELVQGVPISRYCDEAGLSPRARLELFVQVCRAVQHAHQKGIIHRDLKPSNILVGTAEGRALPKIIDFGVAKAIHQPLCDERQLTALGAMIGTPEYMAPEQAVVTNADIDTRADIYSLGVILYELLTGVTPFAAAELQDATYDCMLRMIREIDPPRPSTRLSSATALTEFAARCNTEPRQLTRLLHGDLDWIVMKCLEKERQRRYESVEQLAQDVERYLANEPVQARPPSTAYRIRKFVRRHRGPVIAASLVLIALLLGVTGTTWGWVIALRERDEKELARAAEAKERELALAACDALANAHGNAGRFDEAIPVLQLLRTRQEERVGVDDPSTLRAANNQAFAMRMAGQMAAAIPLFERVRTAQIAKLGSEHLDTLQTEENLAETYRDVGRIADAIPLLEQVRDIRTRLFGADDVKTLSTVNNLAVTYQYAGRVQDAIPLYEAVWQGSVKRQGADHKHTLIMLNNLASAYAASGAVDKAIPLFEQGRASFTKTLGPEHPNTLASLNNLAEAYLRAKRLDEAEKVYRECLTSRERRDTDAWETHQTRAGLGAVCLAKKDYGAAEPLLTQGFEGLKRQQAKMPAAARDRRLKETATWLVRLCEERGQVEAAASWRSELAKLGG